VEGAASQASRITFLERRLSILFTGCWVIAGFVILTCLSLGWLPASERITSAPVEFLTLCIGYPFFEEVFFRGFLLGWLKERFNNRYLLPALSKANLLTSAIFAVVHILLKGGDLSGLTFFPSLVLGYLRELGGSVTACIVVHAIWNFALLMFLF
jgi:uncharacterized protein